MAIDPKQNQIKNPYAIFNVDETQYAKKLLVESSKNISETKQDEYIKNNKTNNGNKKKIIALLGLIGTAILAFFSFNKFKALKTVQPNLNEDIIKKLKILDFKNIEQAISGLNETDKKWVYEVLDLFKINRNKIFIDGKKVVNFDKLGQSIAIEKSKISIGNYRVPDIVFIENVADDEISGVQEILSNCFDSDSKKLTYVKGKLSEFFTYFNEFNKSTSEKTDKSIRTFFRIENFSEFMEDIQKKASEDEKRIFSDFIQSCSIKNNVSLVVNNKHQQTLQDFNSKGIILDFNGITSENIKKYIENSKAINWINKSKTASNFKIKPMSLNFDLWWGDYLSNPKRENIILEGLNKKINQMFLQEFASNSGLTLETIDLKEKPVDKLLELVKSFELEYQITGRERLLYIKNIQDFLSKNGDTTPEFAKLKEFLTTSYDKYGIQSIYDVDKISELPKNFLNFEVGSINLKFKNSFADYKKIQDEIDKLGSELVDESTELIAEKTSLLNNFYKTIELEAKGMDVEVPNGIMLYGKNLEKINQILDWIKTKNITQIQEYSYNFKSPQDSMNKIIEMAENAQKQYIETGRRTIIFIDNLDELLTSDDTLEGRMYISKFKSFIENASENYHTTILMKTTKSLDLFEDASIGSQRFNIKIRI